MLANAADWRLSTLSYSLSAASTACSSGSVPGNWGVLRKASIILNASCIRPSERLACWVACSVLPCCMSISDVDSNSRARRNTV
ncbi:hypothetical protein LMG3412_06016 [Achromobacter deleyi]|nr:hypothetical protein LMG3412_06016 [Achromobacter deleyi]